MEVPNSEKPTYEGREIHLGPRAGDYYVVKSGLQPGTRVVTRGAFKIDADLQIQARSSMMSPKKAPAELRRELKPLLKSYFQVQDALAQDDLGGARDASLGMLETFHKVRGRLRRGVSRELWMDHSTTISYVVREMSDAGQLKGKRQQFATLSTSLAQLLDDSGLAAKEPVYRYYCPMAFDGRGAVWLQKPPKKARNPYMGQDMPRCGELEKVYGAEGNKAMAPPQPSEQKKRPPATQLRPPDKMAPGLDAEAGLRTALFTGTN